MALPPCHCFCQFFVSCENDTPKYLDCLLYQRSGDMFLGVPFNIALYVLLLSMIAHLTNLIPRKLIHDLGDTHIYLNHIEQVIELLKHIPYKFCNLLLSEDVKNIDDFTLNDITIKNYKSWSAIKGEMSI